MQLLQKLETYVRVGDIVLWYPQGDVDLDAHAAMVCRLGMDTVVDLHVMEPSMVSRIPIDGARHVSDAEIRSEERLESGCWKHKPETLAARVMLLQQGVLKFDGEDLDFAPYVDARAAQREAAEKKKLATAGK